MKTFKPKLMPALLLATMLSACGDTGDDDYVEYEMGYSDFIEHVKNGNVKEISLESDNYARQSIYWKSNVLYCNNIKPKTNDCSNDKEQQKTDTTVKNYEYNIHVPVNENVYERVAGNGVAVSVKDSSWGAVPYVVILALLTIFASFIFGPKLARIFKKSSDDKEISFEDIAGVDEAVEKIEDIIDFLKNPQKYREMGLKVPRGALLSGPPGNGKTLIAKAIATEAGVPFLGYAGPEFNDSKFMGVGTRKIKQAFSQARKKAKKDGACIIFMDEFDSVGAKRSGMDGGASAGGSTEGATIDRENQVNQLLVELDGFDSHEHNIVLIAATNRPNALDPAIIRPGRIDRQIHIGQPDIKSREKILDIHLKKYPCEDKVNAKSIAKVTYNFSGADLAGLVNEAGMRAVKSGRKKISWDDIELARDEQLLGAESKSRQFSELEKEITTYHEAGHAYVGHMLPHSFPVYKATIVPRGETLGVVHRAPNSDVSSASIARLKADLAVAMAGRVAEELVFGKENVTSGAQGDFQQANQIAKSMVLQSGMSSDLKPYFVEAQQGLISHSVSPKNLKYLEDEIEKLLQEAMNTAKQLITKGWDDFIALAKALREKETLDADEMAKILGKNVVSDKILPNLTHPQKRKHSPRV